MSGSKNENYKELVGDMLTSVHSLSARMSVKFHFLFSHLEKVSWESSCRFRRARWDISSGHKGHGGTISRALGCAYDGRLLLEFDARKSWNLWNEISKAYIFANLLFFTVFYVVQFFYRLHWKFILTYLFLDWFYMSVIQHLKLK